jgi:hypothetical protein
MLHFKTKRLGVVVAGAVLACAPLACGGRPSPEYKGDPYSSTGDSRHEEPRESSQAGSERGSFQGGTQPGPGTADRLPQASSTAEGVLTNVDANSQEISLKTPTGTMNFRYDDRTTITGSQAGRAGLAATKGLQVMVQYRTDGTQNVATMIGVRSGAENSRRERAPGTGNSPTQVPAGQLPGTSPDRPGQNR